MYIISNMTNNIDINKFNDFLNKANEALSCDASCQENKKSNELKRKYLESKTNLLTAPEQVEVSFKNYLTYTKGDNAYNEYHDKQLEMKANTAVTKFRDNFHEAIKKTAELYDTYSGLLLNFNHVSDLYIKLVQENTKLELEVKNKFSDVLTNDRKSYYEDQNIDNLRFYHKVFMGLYIIILIVFVISIFMFPSSLSKGILFAILIIFIIYPFVCNKIFLFLFNIYNSFLGVLPKNVYKDI
jgi:hypothetical protein